MSEEIEQEEEVVDEPSDDEVTIVAKAVRKSAKKKKDYIDEEDDEKWAKESGTWDKVISTGSTLLDLAISGGVVRGGGLPGGFILEISGGEASGKTTIGCETVASAQSKGGECQILDPEHRLTPEYCKTMGIKFNKDEYYNPETVEEVFDYLTGPLVEKGGKTRRDFSQAWNPDSTNINICMVDSIASLSGAMELNQGDAMGGNRPRQFSQGLRLSKSRFRKTKSILFLTNQLRDNMSGFGKKKYAAGGNAVKFYSSVRIELGSPFKLSKKESTRGREHKKTYGQITEAIIIKNSLDDPYRSALVYLIFGYGIDDVRANLQYLKDNGGFDTEEDGKTKKGTKYIVGDKGYGSIQDAIDAVEAEGREDEIKNKTIDLWEEIQESFKIERKPKNR